jgi:hypothetical protein
MKRLVHPVLLFAIAAVLFCSPVLGQYGAPSWSEPTRERPALDVPYVPTPPEVVARMLDLAGVGNNDVLYDLGCGDGRIVVTAARERRVRKAVGFDLDPKRISESVENARKAGVSGRVRFEQKNLFDVDLGEATVLSLYLLPTVNLQLRPKLFRELKPGTRIVSHDFDMAEWIPDQTVRLGAHTVYYWVMPANAGGTWSWSLSDGRKEHTYELRLEQRFQNVEHAHLVLDGKEQDISQVRVNGSTLEFTAEGVMNGRRQQLRFSGTVQGDVLHGKVTSPHKPGASRLWTAEREAASASPLDRMDQKQIVL